MDKLCVLAVGLIVAALLGMAPAALADVEASGTLFGTTTSPDPETFIHQQAAAVLAKNPGAAKYLQGALALRERKMPEAADLFGQAIAENDEDALFYQGRGIALALADRLPDAVKDFARSLQLDANNKVSMAWMGALQIAMKGNPIGQRGGYDLNQGIPHQEELHDWAWAHVKDGGVAPKTPAGADRAQTLANATAQTLLAQSFLLPLEIDQALELHQAGKDAAALNLLAITRATFHNDPVWLSLDAQVRLALGHNDDARDEFIRVLNELPNLARAYLGLGLANARLGELHQAESDFAAANQIDLALTKEFRAKHDAKIAELAASMPKDAPAKLAADLLDAAGKGEDLSKLTARATALLRATNAVRKRADEVFDNGLRRLQTQVSAEPNNSDRWSDLAKYLYLESNVRTVWNGPHNPPQSLRNQDEKEHQHELALAEQYADKALALNPKNVEAIATKAWLLSIRGQNKDAEDLADAGLALAPDYPRLARLKSAILAASSDTAWATAHKLSSPTMISGYYWWAIIQPTHEELEQAKAYQAMSWQNMSDATEANKRAFQKYAGTVAGFLSRAEYYDWVNSAPEEIANYEEVLKLDPSNLAALEALSEVYEEKLNQPDKALDYRMRAIGTMATTAAPLLEQAWELIGQTRWRSAGEMLSRALATDPADARIYAYNAVICSGQNQLDQAISYWRCVLALEEARVRLNGHTLMDDHGPPLIKHDVLLAAEARFGLFKALMAQGKSDEALSQKQASEALKARARWVSDRTDLPFVGLPAVAKPDAAVLPAGEDTRALTAKANLIEGQKALEAGRLEDAAKLFTQVRKARYAGGEDAGKTRAYVEDTNYHIYLQLKKRYTMNQLGQFFEGQELHEFDMRDRNPGYRP